MSKYHRSKVSIQVVFLIRKCAQCSARIRKNISAAASPSSTLLHAAIMRDKALFNEQLHVVRTVPITNHCV